MRVVHSASLRPLTGKRITILGYGSQGAAQALNLRDAGFVATIGLPEKSGTRRIARRDGFKVVIPSRGVAAASAGWMTRACPMPWPGASAPGGSNSPRA